MKAGDIIRYIKTQNRYRLIFDKQRGRMKVNGKWVPCYIYRPEGDHAGPVYCKEVAEFEEGFEKVE